MADEIEEYRSSLEDLTFNSKPHINNLTILADENKKYAPHIVRLVEEKLSKASTKLPILYLLDSIVKNVGENYKPLFAENIVNTFKTVFDVSDDKAKMSLYKLRTTWDNYFPLKRLYQLDSTIQGLDPNWPVKPLPTSLQDSHTNIHVNPKFLKKASETAPSKTASGASNKPQSKPALVPTSDVDKIKQQLVQQQKELLELQQKKLMLELEQTKQQLEAKQKELTKTSVKKPEPVLKDPRAKAVLKGSLKVTVPNQTPAPVPAKDPPKTILKDPPKTILKDPRGKKPQTEKNSLPAVNNSVGKTSAVAPSNSSRITPKLKKNKKSSPTANSVPAVKNPSTAQKKVPEKVKDISKQKSPKRNKKGQMAPSTPPRENEMRKKRNYRNKNRSPTPPPSKVPRNLSPKLPPQCSMSPEGHDPRRFPQHRERQMHEENMHSRAPDFSLSSDGSLSPSFSPEPDTDEPSYERNQVPPRRKKLNKFERNARRKGFKPELEIPEGLTLGHQSEILRQADAQLQNGQLTHEQHQNLLKKLHQLFELQRKRKIQTGEAVSPRGNRAPKMAFRDQPTMDPRRQSSMLSHERFPPQGMKDKERRLHQPSRMLPSHGNGHPGKHIDPRFGPPSMKRIPRRQPLGPYNDPYSERPAQDARNDPRSHSKQNIPFQKEDVKVFKDQKRKSKSPSDIHLSPPKFMKKDGDLSSKNRTASNKTLRVYAHREVENSDETALKVEKNTHEPVTQTEQMSVSESSAGEEEGKPKLEEPEDYIIANIPKNNDEKPLLEEPEDYIIANIPTQQGPIPCEEPEDYIIANLKEKEKNNEKQSTGLEKNSESEKAYMEHMKKIKQSMYQKELKTKQTDIKVEQKLDNNNSVDDTGPVSTNELSSDNELAKRSEDPLKSPPLPLKKRRYVSAESDHQVKSEQPDPDENFPIPDLKDPDEASMANATDTSEQDKILPEGIDRKIVKTEPEDNDLPSKRDVEESDKLASRSSSAKTFDEFKHELDKDSIVYIYDEEGDEAEAGRISPHHFHSKFDPRTRRGRFPARPPLLHRPRDEERFSRRVEGEPLNYEWDESSRLRHEVEDPWILERSRRGSLHPRFLRERGGFHSVDRWHSPDHEMGEPSFDGPRVIPGRHPRRHPLLRPPHRREPVHYHPEKRFQISPPPLPPDFVLEGRRPLSPPRRTLPPPRHPADLQERAPDWDRPREDRFSPINPADKFVKEIERDSPVPSNNTNPAPAPIDQVNVNKLLSDLLSMGILPGASKQEVKSESPLSMDASTSLPKTVTAVEEMPVEKKEPQPAPSEPAPRSDPVPDEPQRSASPLEEDLLTIDPDANLPEVTLTSNLKIRHDEIIKRLYTGIQCSACGLRFTTRQTDIYAEHLDWHYRLNRKDKEGGAQVHRELYSTAGDWICNEEIENPLERERNAFFEGPEEENEDEPLAVPLTGKAGEDTCKVCGEAFETVYNELEDEWQFINCVKVDEDNFHSNCYEDYCDAPPVQTPVKSTVASANPGTEDHDDDVAQTTATVDPDYSSDEDSVKVLVNESSAKEKATGHDYKEESEPMLTEEQTEQPSQESGPQSLVESPVEGGATPGDAETAESPNQTLPALQDVAAVGTPSLPANEDGVSIENTGQFVADTRQDGEACAGTSTVNLVSVELQPCVAAEPANLTQEPSGVDNNPNVAEQKEADESSQ